MDLRANIAVMNILVKLLIYLHIPCKKTINEKYWLVIAAGMLRPISKNIFNHPCTDKIGTRQFLYNQAFVGEGFRCATGQLVF